MVRQRTGGPPQTVKVVTSTENPQPAARPAHGQGDHFGRSPDLRVNALPGLPNPLSRGDQWHMPTSLAAYSCGGSPGVGLAPSPGSLFIRRGDARTEALSNYSGRFQDAMRDASPSMLETTNGSRKQKGGALAPPVRLRSHGSSMQEPDFAGLWWDQSATFTICLPRFFPCNRPMNAAGAAARPSAISSTYLT